MTSAQTSGAEPALPPVLAPDAFSSMFQSIAGLRNLRAAAAMLGCFVAGVLVAGLLGYLGRGSFVVTGLAGLLAALLFFTGIHAAGVLLMDQARRLPPRSVIDAVVYGLMCVPKTIALMLLMLLAVIALYVVMWLLFLVCKIPGLGPVLFTFVFPACVLLAGLTVVGLMISLQMALPGPYMPMSWMRTAPFSTPCSHVQRTTGAEFFMMYANACVSSSHEKASPALHCW